MSIEPFNRLVKLAARAFYDNVTTKGDNQPKMGRGDNRGIAVVVLDALTRRQWVREEDFAKELKLHSKQLRRILRLFEEEKLVTRDHRRETAKGAKIYSAAVAATVDNQVGGKEGEEKIKLHTHSYCCLDYAQIYDVVRYRLYRMKKKKDELEDKNTVQEYVCPGCGKRYNALDALRLVSLEDEIFTAKDGYGGTPMPFLGETKVEVDFSGVDGNEDVKSESASTSSKVLPPWMIKKGMNLTKEQRGEVKQESKIDGSSNTT
ncbi:General transcription factor IIE subunit 1 isoform 3 [Hibiscus syriacus]|uniref:General transcription factor IIE subunit 1 isoform 3 n=1 Tax=Hibiscus syriacus TaxID=106335 RepID=A0A6A2WBC3_HIBSY|nr:General transcription factor IIE subunit 1 isoform 3 [Hibiscus syriacus]